MSALLAQQRGIGAANVGRIGCAKGTVAQPMWPK
jgi:hypothetical protein